MSAKTDGPPIIEFSSVNKWYGEFHVLRNIELDVWKGERIVDLGSVDTASFPVAVSTNGVWVVGRIRIPLRGSASSAFFSTTGTIGTPAAL